MKSIKVYYHKTVITLIPTIKFIWAESHSYKSIEISFLFFDINFSIN